MTSTYKLIFLKNGMKNTTCILIFYKRNSNVPVYLYRSMK